MLSTRGRRVLWHDPLAWVAAAVLVAALFAPSVVPTLQLFSVSVVVLVATALCFLLPFDRRVLVVLMAFELTASWCWFTMLERSTIELPSSMTVTGNISSLPTISGSGEQVSVDITSSSAPVLIGRIVSVSVSGEQDLSPGRVVTCHCSVSEFPIDSHQQYLQQLERNTVSLRSGGPLELGRGSSSPRWWLLKLRSVIVERVNELWPAPQSSLAAGLIVGSREQFSAALTAAMQRTGTTHIVAVSGENVAVALWMFDWWLPRKKPWARAGILSVVLLLFALLTGMTASVVRAGIAAFLVLLARGFGRPTSILRILLIVAAAMAALDPLVVRANLGFQLSFLAVFGLVAFAEPLAKLIPLPRWLGGPIATTLAASLCTAPLLAASFGIVSIISPLANLVLVAIVNPTMLLAIVALIASIILPLGQFLAWLTWPFLAFITYVIDVASKIPGAAVSLTFPLWGAWAMIAGIGVFGYWLEYRKQKKALA